MTTLYTLRDGSTTGRRVGGHAYVTVGYSIKREGYTIPNSWGGEGAGLIHREDGEACIPVLRNLA